MFLIYFIRTKISASQNIIFLICQWVWLRGLGTSAHLWMATHVRKGCQVPVIGTSKGITWYEWQTFSLERNVLSSQTELWDQTRSWFNVTSWQSQTELVAPFSLFIVLWLYCTGYFVLLMYWFAKYVLSTVYVSGTVVGTSYIVVKKIHTSSPISSS